MEYSINSTAFGLLRSCHPESVVFERVRFMKVASVCLVVIMSTRLLSCQEKNLHLSDCTTIAGSFLDGLAVLVALGVPKRFIRSVSQALVFLVATSSNKVLERKIDGNFYLTYWRTPIDPTWSSGLFLCHHCSASADHPSLPC